MPRKNRACINFSECGKIAITNGIDFSCDTCDGLPLHRAAGLYCETHSQGKRCADFFDGQHYYPAPPEGLPCNVRLSTF